MRCRSKNREACREARNTQYAIRNTRQKAFGLVETVTALIILALVSSSVLVVINRCMASAADSVLRMQAFEVARENMETLLSKSSVQETVEYGESEMYPEIKWQTVVETFYEPITGRMWVRGVCSAEYKNTADEVQTVELTHWLTDLTKEQLLQIMRGEDKEMEQLAGQLIETIEEAALYAGVEIETIEQWVENGMLTAEDGSFIKKNLDIYKQSNGTPSEEEKQLQVQSEADLTEPTTEQGEPGKQDGSDEQDWRDEIDPKTGLTYGELEGMDVQEVWKLLKNRQP